MWKFVMQRISIKNALCYEQTSPLGVPMYAFGFSLFVLHYFSFAPQSGCSKMRFHFAAASSILSFINLYFPLPTEMLSGFILFSKKRNTFLFADSESSLDTESALSQLALAMISLSEITFVKMPFSSYSAI